MNRRILSKLTSRVVDVEEGSEWISLGDQTVSDFAWNAFVAILSVNLENLKRVDGLSNDGSDWPRSSHYLIARNQPRRQAGDWWRQRENRRDVLHILDDDHEIDAGDVAAVLTRLRICVLQREKLTVSRSLFKECRKCIKFAIIFRFRVATGSVRRATFTFFLYLASAPTRLVFTVTSMQRNALNKATH